VSDDKQARFFSPNCRPDYDRLLVSQYSNSRSVSSVLINNNNNNNYNHIDNDEDDINDISYRDVGGVSHSG